MPVDANKSIPVLSMDVPRFERVTFGKHSTKYLGSTLWNEIRTDLRNHLSLDAFKRAVKKLDLH